MMKKRIISIALALCLVLSLLPMVAFAGEAVQEQTALAEPAAAQPVTERAIATPPEKAEPNATYYDIWVGGKQFSSSETRFNFNGGTATYNNSQKRLTLDGVNISYTGDNAAIHSKIPGLTILVKGRNIISVVGANDACGLYLETDTFITGESRTSSTLIVGLEGKQTLGKAGITTQMDGETRPMLRLQDLTYSCVDDTTDAAQKGYAAALDLHGALEATNCVIGGSNLWRGVLMQSDDDCVFNECAFNFTSAARQNVNDTQMSDLSVGLYLSGGTNSFRNCSANITANYPIYTKGDTTLWHCNDFYLNSTGSTCAAVYVPGGELVLELGSQTIQSEGNGYAVTGSAQLELHDTGLITIDAANIGMALTDTASALVNDYGLNITAEAGLYLQDEGCTFTCQGSGYRSVAIQGKSAGSTGITTSGTVEVKSGKLDISGVRYAISNEGTKPVTFSGGTSTLSTTTNGSGYFPSLDTENNNNANDLVVSGGSLTINAWRPVQTYGSLIVTGGTLNLNHGQDAVYTQKGISISGGTVNATYLESQKTSNTDKPSGLTSSGRISISGDSTVVNFQNNETDIISVNAESEISGGKVNLAPTEYGMMLGGNFKISGGEVVISGAGSDVWGIYQQSGTLSLTGGSLKTEACSYGLILGENCVTDFHGTQADIFGKKTALGFAANTANYKVLDGEVTFRSDTKAAGGMYSEIARGYTVYAGADRNTASEVANPAHSTFQNNKYVRMQPAPKYTLTLVNVKEGTSAAYAEGAGFTYTARDPDEGEHFDHWELTIAGGTAQKVGTSTTYSGTMPAANATLKAVYARCTGGTATCKDKAVCTTCGRAYGSLAAHKLTKTDAVPATCTHSGAEAYWTCGTCGKLFSDAEGRNEIAQPVTVPALGHSLTKTDEVPATCTQPGTEAYWTCGRCGKRFSDAEGRNEIAQPVAIPTLSHSLTKTDEVPATCTQSGTAAYWTCGTCGKLFSDAEGRNEIAQPVTVPALGHSLTKTAEAPATCTQPGTEAYWRCSACGKIFSDENGTTEMEAPVALPALGHSLTKVEAVPATCTQPGTGAYWKCDRCGKLFSDAEGRNELSQPVTTPAPGHSLTKVEEVPATCTENGTEAYWKCDRCGKLFSDAEGTNEISEPVLTPILGHLYEAPCTPAEDGMHYCFCSRCKESVLSPCSALLYDPDCTHEGYTRVSCDLCNESYKINIKPATGHNLTKVEAVPATCTENGTEAYWKCDRCGKLFSDAEGTNEISEPVLTPILGHLYEAPCTSAEDGMHYCSCSRCGESVLSPCSALLYDPDCTHEGYTRVSCDLCNESYKINIKPATGHSFVDGECTVCHAADPDWEEPFVNPFIDVKESDWFYPYMMEMAKDGVINGYSDHTFRPNVNLTRAEMVTLLYRASGSPEVSGKASFTDVPANAWYLTAVTWAEEKGVVNGVGNGEFEPEEDVSREQLVTMLWRLAGKPESDEDLNAYGFADVAKVNSWAKTAMQWAVANKIINGTTFTGKPGTYLAPQDSTTRAEAAKILCVYLEMN